MTNFKIAFYIRCSTEEQGLHANPEGTIKNQEQRLRYEVDAKNRAFKFGKVVSVFVEDGVSAKDTKRPALQRMLKAIELGEINLVMVTEYSRLSRNMRDFSAMWELFKSYKCSVISLRENFDTSTAAGEMMLYNMANLAQYERRMTSERVTLSRLDRAQRGLFNGGIIPLGYMKSSRPGHLEIDEDEAKVIRTAFKQFLKIGSLLQTAKWLNQNKISTTRMIKGTGRARVGHFVVGNLRFILTNKAYVGIVTYKKNGEVFEAEAAWPALVSNDDFSKVQQMIKENHRKKKPHTTSRYPYTLSGLVFCKRCGEGMCGKSAHGRNEKVGYYEHSWSMRKDAALTEKAFQCGMHKRVPARIIDKLIHEKVEKILLNEAIVEGIIKEANLIHFKNHSKVEKEKNLKKEISNYTGQLEALSERLAKLPVDVPADEIYKTMKLLGEKRDRVSSELDGLLKGSEIGCEVPVELKDYKIFLKAIKVLWFNPKSSSELKEKIVRKIIARIEIDTDKVYVEYWVGKGHFRREINSLPNPQVPESPHFFKNVGSRTCHNGAVDWT